MATQHIFLTGLCKWAKVHAPDKEYGYYGMNLYLDKAAKKVFNDSGLRLEIKEDEDGEFIRVRRDPEKLRDWDQEKPTVLIHEGDEYLPFTKNIGNGSLVTAKIQVYDSKKGKGHRLEAVAVEELVPWETEENEEDLPF